jgi:hypothetical protein
MKVASGLAAGPKPLPELASEAVQSALAKADLTQAGAVLLFLTRDFQRQPQPALLAAARAAGCMEIFGSTAYGVITESGWLLDQAGAAALVMEMPSAKKTSGHRLSFTRPQHPALRLASPAQTGWATRQCGRRLGPWSTTC